MIIIVKVLDNLGLKRKTKVKTSFYIKILTIYFIQNTQNMFVVVVAVVDHPKTQAQLSLQCNAIPKGRACILLGPI